MKQHVKPDPVFGRHENRRAGGRTFELGAALIAPQLRIYRTITVHTAQLPYIRHQDGNPITDPSNPSVCVGQLAEFATRQFLLSRLDKIGLRVPLVQSAAARSHKVGMTNNHCVTLCTGDRDLLPLATLTREAYDALKELSHRPIPSIISLDVLVAVALHEQFVRLDTAC